MMILFHGTHYLKEKREEMDLRMAIYAAMIDRMDQNIGRLINDLKTKGLYDNTIIMFLNDNGACAENDMLGSGPKEQLETKEGYLLSYGKAWANASNTPYRSYKHSRRWYWNPIYCPLA